MGRNFAFGAVVVAVQLVSPTPARAVPLTFSETQVIAAMQADSGYGAQVVGHGDFVVAAAPSASFGNSSFDNGGVYFYRKTAGVWLEEFSMESDMTLRRGRSMAANGNKVAIGNDYGVEVMQYVGGNWQYLTTVYDNNISFNLGYAVAVTDTHTILTDPSVDDSRGVVVTEPHTGFNFDITLSSMVLDPHDSFGWSVAAVGDVLLVGAPGDDDAGFSAGAVYVFEFGNFDWTQVEKLTFAGSGGVGRKVAYDGTTAVIAGTNNFHIVRRQGSTWTTEASVPNSFTENVVVAIEGDIAMLDREVWTRDNGTWSLSDTLPVPLNAVSIQNGVIAKGARDSGAPNDFGQLHFYESAIGPGGPCLTADECGSGFCVEGVCCDTACGGEDSEDCQACTIANGALVDGTCSPLLAATVCRTASGQCDVAEACDGSATTCPADESTVDGSPCDDNDTCTDNDSCTQGMCSGVDMCGSGGGGGTATTSTGSAGGANGGAQQAADEGCSCRAAGGHWRGFAPWGWLALAATMLFRRKRTADRS